ncbi:MAG: hypothetical protein KIT74_02175 [Fimbriimonadales bacterium]|nr:hypothetical protein [Fimbriimonadales bacterium]
MATRRGTSLKAALSAAAILAGGAAMAATNQPLVPGVYYDGDVKITRAVGSPAITVTYSGVRAARMQIRLNGVTIAYRDLDKSRSTGEAGFNLSLERLQEGDNVIEALIFDEAGKRVGSQRLVVSVEQRTDQPIYIRIPKAGDSLQGTVVVDVGLGVQARNAFVSFFVNKEFKGMKNFPPYTFTWDTTRENNGWHEIEVWLYDETQTTIKSPVARVFVENPGGRTERVEPATIPILADPTINPPAGGAKGIKNAEGVAEPAKAVATPIAPVAAPTLPSPGINAPISGDRTAKSIGDLSVQSTGAKISTPNPSQVPKAEAVNVGTTAPAKRTLPIDFGSRITTEMPISIWFNGSPIDFDVQPRIQDGIPLTPFRFLYERAGGQVDWSQKDFVVTATGLGYDVWLKIGNPYARVNGQSVQLELAPFIDSKRTIVPMSFVKDVLDVDIDFDPATGHVLITQAKKAEQKK